MRPSDQRDLFLFEDPIRAEILSSTRFEQLAESLARSHRLLRDPKQGKELSSRVKSNRQVLQQAYFEIVRAVEKQRAITPAGEWLIDNFHVVRSLLQDIREHLPKKFYQQLPKLADGPFAGYPRVYALAWEFVAHTDSHFDGDLLRHFLQAYQKTQPLLIGELWAVPITLRLVMIENLRRLAVRIAGSQVARQEADEIANEILGLHGQPAVPIKAVHEKWKHKHFIPAFSVQLLQRFRFQDSSVQPLLKRIEEELATENHTPDSIISLEHSRQTAANASVRNLILSARTMSSFNWYGFFEDVSLVEAALRKNSLYDQLDFQTRDSYRRMVEEISKYGDQSEIGVAELAVAKSSNAVQDTAMDEDTRRRSQDVGYFLIDKGRFDVEQELNVSLPWRQRATRFYIRNATFIYLSSLLVLTAGIVAFPVFSVWNFLSVGLLTFLAILGLFPASEIAITIVHRVTVGLLGPRHLPRFNLEKGLPAEMRSFVVVPTFLSDASKIDSQLEQLEIHWLSNPCGEVYFALLTDWPDSNEERTAFDDQLLKIASEKVALLNDKYGFSSAGYDRFYIFHRKRQFNPSENCWMGWERKRGKLEEFNRLLLGDANVSYITLGDEKNKIPPDIKYVITLDADTRIPHASVAQMVGTLAHPLNRAYLDPVKKRVTRGFGLLQPRVTPTLPSNADCTLFQKLSTSDAGIDPYASAVSDVYQDLFHEGSFTGKGIYDVRVFDSAMRGRVPENSLLSHDLFEGNFVRCGFLNDVEFFEDFPSHVGVAALRQHRWIRGDWQLLPWIFGRRGSGLSLMHRWKMFDNLRRSLCAPAAFMLLVTSFCLSSELSDAWIALVLLSLFAPFLISFVVDLTWPSKVSFKQRLNDLVQDFDRGLSWCFLQTSFLASQAWLNADAIGRVFYRTLISGKKKLEWTTSAQARSSARHDLPGFIRSFRSSWGLTIVTLILIGLSADRSLVAASAFLVLWTLAPFVAYLASTPPKQKILKHLSEENSIFLQHTARKIWLFFTTFVTESEKHLPPDNFQEDPKPEIAHRSSPTNFGLYLLSTLSAYDFGWIGLIEMSERLEKTLKSMRDLPKYDGHFYNWYETTTGAALEPRYISSVDNGNLAGHLVAIAQACLQFLDLPIVAPSPKRTALQSYAILKKAVEDAQTTPVTGQELTHAFRELCLAHTSWVSGESDWSRFQKEALVFRHVLHSLEKHDLHGSLKEVRIWAESLSEEIRSVGRDWELLMSWEIGIKRPMVSLRDLSGHCEELLQEMRTGEDGWDVEIAEKLQAASLEARFLRRRLQDVEQLCRDMIQSMDFGLLYDRNRKLFSIGYRVGERELDPSYYDLMASEARLTSFVAIAKGDVPVSHWFSLSRALKSVENGAALVSWSGSMFEYLMPSLVMETPKGSLIDQTCELAIQEQVRYGHERKVPWGVSESGYNKRDLHLTYQYSSFGVPDLGLKRGLGADLVIAPYASLLSTMYSPVAAADNLLRLKEMGAMGTYGFYEALDFTPSRLPTGQQVAIVKSYMSHHQGMSLVSLANLFLGDRIRSRFHSDPLSRSAELLLQEKTPRHVSAAKPLKESSRVVRVKEEVESSTRQYHNVNRPVPTTLLLCNGDYSLMLTSAGSGYSRFRETALTRWREDVTKDDWGTYLFLKDVKTKNIWSATYQPTCAEPDLYEVNFSEDRARFARVDHGIASDLEIILSPEDGAEIRRLKLVNRTESERVIEVTSYCEVVLNSHAADVAHPAFSNLFVQTEALPAMNALIANRRPRSANEKPLWMGQVMTVEKGEIGTFEFETDRSKFLGRGRNIHNAVAIEDDMVLTGTSGPVLDPIMSIRKKVKIPPGGTVQVVLSTLVAANQADLLSLVERYSDQNPFDRVAHLAWTHAQVRLHYLNMEPDEANLFQRLATRLLFLDSSLRPSSGVIQRSERGVTSLWKHGISGDFPIVLLRIDDIEDRGIVRQLLKACDYLGSKWLRFDLVILNDQKSSYAQDLQQTLEWMTQTQRLHSALSSCKNKVFLLRSDLISEDDRLLLYATARAKLSSRQGSLSEQVKRHQAPRLKVKRPLPKSEIQKYDSLIGIPKLQYFNGLGGFTEDGREYAIVLKDGQTTPAPWLNVIANSRFGFQVSESGSGYTWSMNSRENQITPWMNDPVGDPSGEAIYLRDQETGVVWSPTTWPIRHADATYLSFHGAGYSRFETSYQGIHSELVQFVPSESSVKVSILTLRNDSEKARKIQVTSYVEWVLGFFKSQLAPRTVTDLDETSNSVFAWNHVTDEFGHRVAFTFLSEKFDRMTCDRSEFIGRNGTAGRPGAFVREGDLSGHHGAGFDPCTALQKELDIPAKGQVEISIYLGQASNRFEAREMVHTLRQKNARALLEQVKTEWNQILDQVQVRTPDPSFDLMLNRWLLYQTLACRFYSRSAFYQAGGAYGFRDQLQDSMALVTSKPELVRRHILLAASRQFVEGDVQHWWHPPSGRGVRTHFSDDLIWLPEVVNHYLRVTEDHSILDEQVHFIEGPLLAPHQEDAYFVPETSKQKASLYEHCARALDRNLATGAHGLPLIGCGDWNDGMNRIGHEGKGESVWLGWFMIQNLRQFAKIAAQRGDAEHEKKWLDHAEKLRLAIEEQSWDGGWYRRAYFDDGTPVGSAQNQECQIDSLGQTWAILSGAGNRARSIKAMQAVENHLVKKDQKVILLFTPAFDKTPLDPGYIKGYLPGVRENGGQYTHAAIWCVMAEVALGEGTKAFELFSLLNPVKHGGNAKDIQTYKVEPYVVAADVYSVKSQEGRGGWTWYTGSSGWMYRAGVESILGIRQRGRHLLIDPCLPSDWKQFEVDYRYGRTLYQIRVLNPHGLQKGKPIQIPLVDDGETHLFTLEMTARNEQPLSDVGLNRQ